MLTFLRNLDREHDLDAFIVEFGGKTVDTTDLKHFGSITNHRKGRGKAKGNCVWNKVDTFGENTIEEFWIKYLVFALDSVSKSNVNPNSIHDIHSIV
ncbi:unnamed protein product, partial [marine sediment metagenome]